MVMVCEGEISSARRTELMLKYGHIINKSAAYLQTSIPEAPSRQERRTVELRLERQRDELKLKRKIDEMRQEHEREVLRQERMRDKLRQKRERDEFRQTISAMKKSTDIPCGGNDFAQLLGDAGFPPGSLGYTATFQEFLK